jgi:hypothetical protein
MAIDGRAVPHDRIGDKPAAIPSAHPEDSAVCDSIEIPDSEIS